MEYKRQIYLDALIRKKGNGLIKIITGLRRSGKSYLLRTLFKNHLLSEGVPQSHIVELAFDSRQNKALLNPDVFFEWANTKICDCENYYFLLDEIQLMDDFESVLNGLNDKKNIDIYVTGSNAKFLSKDIVTEFSGRGDEIHIYPLSFSEFMQNYKGDKMQGFSEYMIYGGIPLVAQASIEDKSKILNNFIKETYIRDIVLRNKVRNKTELESLLNILASSIGSPTNPEKLMHTFKSVKKSKITANTITKYISYFEDSFLIESVMRFDVKGKSYIKSPKKYYFSDVGLRNSQIGFRQNEVTHLMENIIYNELKIRGYQIDVGIVPIAEKDANNKTKRKQLEIDFICTKGIEKFYIQSSYSVAYEEKRNQEIRPFLKTQDFFKKILITNDFTPQFYDDNGILTINLFDFLLGNLI